MLILHALREAPFQLALTHRCQLVARRQLLDVTAKLWHSIHQSRPAAHPLCSSPMPSASAPCRVARSLAPVRAQELFCLQDRDLVLSSRHLRVRCKFARLRLTSAALERLLRDLYRRERRERTWEAPQAVVTEGTSSTRRGPRCTLTRGDRTGRSVCRDLLLDKTVTVSRYSIGAAVWCLVWCNGICCLLHCPKLLLSISGLGGVTRSSLALSSSTRARERSRDLFAICTERLDTQQHCTKKMKRHYSTESNSARLRFNCKAALAQGFPRVRHTAALGKR